MQSTKAAESIIEIQTLKSLMQTLDIAHSSGYTVMAESIVAEIYARFDSKLSQPVGSA